MATDNDSPPPRSSLASAIPALTMEDRVEASEANMPYDTRPPSQPDLFAGLMAAFPSSPNTEDINHGRSNHRRRKSEPNSSRPVRVTVPRSAKMAAKTAKKKGKRGRPPATKKTSKATTKPTTKATAELTAKPIKMTSKTAISVVKAAEGNSLKDPTAATGIDPLLSAKRRRMATESLDGTTTTTTTMSGINKSAGAAKASKNANSTNEKVDSPAITIKNKRGRPRKGSRTSRTVKKSARISSLQADREEEAAAAARAQRRRTIARSPEPDVSSQKRRSAPLPSPSGKSKNVRRSHQGAAGRSPRPTTDRTEKLQSFRVDGTPTAASDNEVDSSNRVDSLPDGVAAFDVKIDKRSKTKGRPAQKNPKVISSSILSSILSNQDLKGKGRKGPPLRHGPTSYCHQCVTPLPKFCADQAVHARDCQNNHLYMGVVVGEVQESIMDNGGGGGGGRKWKGEECNYSNFSKETGGIRWWSGGYIYFVHYLGWSSRWDRWVGEADLVPRSMACTFVQQMAHVVKEIRTKKRKIENVNSGGSDNAEVKKKHEGTKEKSEDSNHTKRRESVTSSNYTTKEDMVKDKRKGSNRLRRSARGSTSDNVESDITDHKMRGSSRLRRNQSELSAMVQIEGDDNTVDKRRGFSRPRRSKHGNSEVPSLTEVESDITESKKKKPGPRKRNVRGKDGDKIDSNQGAGTDKAEESNVIQGKPKDYDALQKAESDKGLDSGGTVSADKMGRYTEQGMGFSQIKKKKRSRQLLSAGRISSEPAPVRTIAALTSQVSVTASLGSWIGNKHGLWYWSGRMPCSNTDNASQDKSGANNKIDQDAIVADLTKLIIPSWKPTNSGWKYLLERRYEARMKSKITAAKRQPSDVVSKTFTFGKGDGNEICENLSSPTANSSNCDMLPVLKADKGKNDTSNSMKNEEQDQCGKTVSSIRKNECVPMEVDNVVELKNETEFTLQKEESDMPKPAGTATLSTSITKTSEVKMLERASKSLSVKKKVIERVEKEALISTVEASSPAILSTNDDKTTSKTSKPTSLHSNNAQPLSPVFIKDRIVENGSNVASMKGDNSNASTLTDTTGNMSSLAFSKKKQKNDGLKSNTEIESADELDLDGDVVELLPITILPLNKEEYLDFLENVEVMCIRHIMLENPNHMPDDEKVTAYMESLRHYLNCSYSFATDSDHPTESLPVLEACSDLLIILTVLRRVIDPAEKIVHESDSAILSSLLHLSASLSDHSRALLVLAILLRHASDEIKEMVLSCEGLVLCLLSIGPSDTDIDAPPSPFNGLFQITQPNDLECWVTILFSLLGKPSCRHILGSHERLYGSLLRIATGGPVSRMHPLPSNLESKSCAVGALHRLTKCSANGHSMATYRDGIILLVLPLLIKRNVCGYTTNVTADGALAALRSLANSPPSGHIMAQSIPLLRNMCQIICEDNGGGGRVLVSLELRCKAAKFLQVISASGHVKLSLHPFILTSLTGLLYRRIRSWSSLHSMNMGEGAPTISTSFVEGARSFRNKSKQGKATEKTTFAQVDLLIPVVQCISVLATCPGNSSIMARENWLVSSMLRLAQLTSNDTMKKLLKETLMLLITDM